MCHLCYFVEKKRNQFGGQHQAVQPEISHPENREESVSLFDSWESDSDMPVMHRSSNFSPPEGAPPPSFVNPNTRNLGSLAVASEPQMGLVGILPPPEEPEVPLHLVGETDANAGEPAYVANYLDSVRVDLAEKPSSHFWRIFRFNVGKTLPHSSPQIPSLTRAARVIVQRVPPFRSASRHPHQNLAVNGPGAETHLSSIR